MDPSCKRSPVTWIQCMGFTFFFLHIVSVEADGKLFAIGSRNGSQSLDLAMAQQSCAAVGAHLANAEELRRAIWYCSFTVCTKGWLADGTIGTTVCNRTGSKAQSVKVIDVQIEMDPSPSGRPCGDPPSFPHTVLHGHTGFEMGDELHYICAQGYVTSNKDSAFTLLCHTCGEWFGQVQACVKGETEGHIDYEDNFPDDLSMPIEEQEENNSRETEEKDHKPEKTIVGGTKTQLADGNHIGLKTIYIEQGSKLIYDDEDVHIGPLLVNNGTGATKSTDSKTDESWLDGYPVTQEAMEEGEAEEEGDNIDGSLGMEDDITSDRPNHTGIGKSGSSSLGKDFMPIGEVPSLTYNTDGILGMPVALTPVSAPENVSISNGSENIIRYVPTTPMEFVTQGLASVDTATSLISATLETSSMLSLIDHILLPEEEEMTTLPTQAVTTVPSQNVFSEPSADDLIERDILNYGLGGKLLTTFEPCVGTECSSSDKGAMIAIGVTVLCLLLLAAIFAMWCFRKRQQKTSVYKLNGKDHPGHQLQQIEMQRV
ncbi:sushi domain-containing protein 5 isoform X2 [Sphaerodactylus townsendi]|uniref:sushi domain-containing protein 5 isoform X2 n=1 Tax=Sphaerodactylus townsendi TaxID=933632 RepID=UPI002026DD5A|nr:sushi domain-containing protein 5 isoform X2 [Sphaerodactylus townsendi]